MRRIDTITKKQIQDKNGKSFDGFIEGDPSKGREATHLSDSWCNNLQEEICNVIEGIGNSVNKEMTLAQDGSKVREVREEKYDQMLQAIKLLAETGTPIGSVKPMSVKMNPNFIARWVPAKRSEKGAMYLSEEMATNCEQVDGNTGRFYKLVTGDKQSGEGSGAFGWALADGKFPLPIELFGQDDEARPKTEEEKNKEEGIEVITDTEYGKIWMDKNERNEFGRLFIRNDKGWRYTMSSVENAEGSVYSWTSASNRLLRDAYFLKEEDLLPRESSVPADDEDVWGDNPKPKLIPNLNDKTFLIGSNEDGLPLKVEGKNGFMMKYHHMPTHIHITPHLPISPLASYSTSDYTQGKSHVYFKTGALTSYGLAQHLIHIASTPTDCTTPVGGYWASSSYHNEGGDMQGRHLVGNVPIDLRPKRMQVYYYIRVI